MLKQLSIGRCPNLEFLYAHDEPLCNSTSIRSSKISEYPSLEYLSLRHCPNLKSVHCFLPSLVNLDIGHCDELESFPGLGLSSIPGMQLSSKLESVVICNCNKLFAGRKQWDLQRLPSLTSFSFDGFEEVESFPDEDLFLPSTLTSLTINCLPNLKFLNYKKLQILTSLGKFTIGDCPKLQSMPQQGLLSSIDYLSISASPLLAQKCQRETGEDWSKISHIHEIWINGNKIN
ncbi:unnamed protein product [Dovyalis caffra]|uniref:Uncharacterized protein n=1 Tax=Dovyalis caffra TaxID=77055 RepID=A0AAV1RQV6_9ROSI|nr:unnamed protein product [Dovyalis caffra]